MLVDLGLAEPCPCPPTLARRAAGLRGAIDCDELQRHGRAQRKASVEAAEGQEGPQGAPSPIVTSLAADYEGGPRGRVRWTDLRVFECEAGEQAGVAGSLHLSASLSVPHLLLPPRVPVVREVEQSCEMGPATSRRPLTSFINQPARPCRSTAPTDSMR